MKINTNTDIFPQATLVKTMTSVTAETLSSVEDVAKQVLTKYFNKRLGCQLDANHSVSDQGKRV